MSNSTNIQLHSSINLDEHSKQISISTEISSIIFSLLSFSKMDIKFKLFILLINQQQKVADVSQHRKVLNLCVIKLFCFFHKQIQNTNYFKSHPNLNTMIQKSKFNNHMMWHVGHLLGLNVYQLYQLPLTEAQLSLAIARF